ncbi:hypothetical protein HPB52_000821 [Rhipicephalus sanguineus]|uniref:MULE transposase domain-containing protein n=1 Tax=Rhipicephalus sanguineus TaxID=34632 RepID=A0A9D4SX73_RHISA|nr:hypothetical protein HPB52_000821 [Rhipicephalus sanguineus]
MLRPTEETKAAFIGYFESSIGPADAIRSHEESLSAKPDGPLLLANGSINPISRSVYYWHEEWRTAKYGPSRSPLPKLLEKVDEYAAAARSVDDERDGSPAAAADASPSGPPACDAPDAPTDDTSLATECAGEHRDSASPSSSADSEGFAEPPEAANGELGLAGLTASDASQGSGRVRRDTTLLTQSELRERQTKADSRLRDLASTAASKRKFDFLKNDAPAGAAPAVPREEASFIIADLGCMGTDVCTRSLSSDCWAVLVVTPIMRRAQHLESARNVIFVDSTSSCDADGSTATVLLTSTKAGAVPVAVLVHSSQSREGYAIAFQLLKQRYPCCFGDKEAPEGFMSDNSSAEKGALSDTWPSAKQLLCTFHVLQAEWRWLTSARNEVTKEDRRQYMERFQKQTTKGQKFCDEGYVRNLTFDELTATSTY